MEDNIKELIELTRFFGSSKEYTVAGGGNSSMKSSKILWVKASGTNMKNIDFNDFVCLDRMVLSKIGKKKYSSFSVEREKEIKEDLQKAILTPTDKRPSVETSLHNIIPYRFVMHTHPAFVNGLLCTVNSRGKVAELFGNDILYVEYTDPGYVLFKKVSSSLLKFEKAKGFFPQIILLENHGVFVSGDSIEDIYDIYRKIQCLLSIDGCKLPTRQTYKLPDFSREKSVIASLYPSRNCSIKVDANAWAQYFTDSKDCFEIVSSPFVPDHIVYCKAHYLFVKREECIKDKLRSFLSKNEYFPKVIGVEKKGVLIVDEDQRSAETGMEVFKDLMKVGYYALQYGQPRPLSQGQIDFIETWEVENYRLKVSKTN